MIMFIERIIMIVALLALIHASFRLVEDFDFAEPGQPSGPQDPEA